MPSSSPARSRGNSYASSRRSASNASSRSISPEHAKSVSTPQADNLADVPKSTECKVAVHTNPRASSSPATTSAANTPRGHPRSTTGAKAPVSPSTSRRTSRSASSSSTSSSHRSSRSASPALSRASSRPPTGSAANVVKAVSASRKTSAADLRRGKGGGVDGVEDGGGRGPLTSEEMAKWRDLEAENKRLVLKLAELNTALDRQLGKQGIHIASRPGGPAAAVGLSLLKENVASSSSNTEAVRLKARIEALRKTNNDMQKALKEHSVVRGSALELKNKHSQLVKELESLRSDNQSLENVYNNQTSKTTQDDKAQKELDRMKGEHHDVQRESREATRQLKELREAEMSNMRLLLKQQDLLNEKLRFLAEEQSSATANGVKGPTESPPEEGESLSSSPQSPQPSKNEYGLLMPTSGRFAVPQSMRNPYDLAELQLVLQSLTNEESDILKDIKSLTSKSHRARWKQVVDKRTAELEDLKDELKLLREHADAKRIAY